MKTLYNRAFSSVSPLKEPVPIYPLKPLVAQRHYIETGTLRYFEQCYADGTCKLQGLTCSDDSYDGLIVYWLDIEAPQKIPEHTIGGKPLIWVQINNFDVLRIRAQ